MGLLPTSYNPALVTLTIAAVMLAFWALADRWREGQWRPGARIRLGVAAVFVAICAFVGA